LPSLGEWLNFIGQWIAVRPTDMDVVIAATSQLTDMPALLLMGLSIVFILYLTFRKRYKSDPLNLPFRASLQQQKALERDMQSVAVELSAMTRQMSAQLETRATKLDLLIQEADQKIASLNAALAAIDAGQSPPTAIDMPLNPAPLKSPGLRLVKDDNADRWAEVYMLADQGLSTSQIAHKLSRPEGEIDLILHIRPKSRQPIDVDVSEASIVSAG
jgi:hypothetical protein